MTAHELYESLRKLGALVLCKHEFKKTGLNYSAVFSPEKIPSVAQCLYEAGYFIEDISAMHVKEGLLATWHFDSFTSPGRIALRALAGADKSLYSIANIYQGAEWHERESADFFGLIFKGNPNPVPLLLPDDFECPPPLLKEEKELASMASLKLFGKAEILDEAWKALAGGEKKSCEEGEA